MRGYAIMFMRRSPEKAEYVEGNPSAKSRGPENEKKPDQRNSKTKQAIQHRKMKRQTFFRKRKVPLQIVMTTTLVSSIHASSISRVNTLETLNLSSPRALLSSLNAMLSPLDHGSASLTHLGG
jgi:hypothetical protein